MRLASRRTRQVRSIHKALVRKGPIMNRRLRWAILTCAMAAAVSVVSLTPSTQSEAQAASQIRISTGRHYSGYGQGYYGGYGRGYGYGQHNGGGYRSGHHGYSGYGNGRYGYGTNYGAYRNYGNVNYYPQSYNQGYYRQYNRGYSSYGYGVSTPLGYFSF